MRWWKLRQEDKCPRCQQDAENKPHITQCQAQEAQNNWRQVLEQSDQWLLSSKTESNIQLEIIQGLQKWHQNDNTPSTDLKSAAATEQELLGWDLAV